MYRIALRSPQWLVIAATFIAPVSGGAQESATPPNRTYVGGPPKVAPAAATQAVKPVAENSEPVVVTDGANYDGATSTMILDSYAVANAWTVRVLPYAWIPGVQGDISVGKVTAPVDASIGKVLDVVWNHINFAAIGQIEASNGCYGMIFNGLYLSVSPGQRVRNLDFGARLETTILDLVATYNLRELTETLPVPAGSSIELLGGVRYLNFTTGITVTGPQGNSASRQGTEDWFDPIIGCRFRVPMHQCLTAQFRGDVGGFAIGDASQFTWNIEATMEYRCSPRSALFAGYRWLDFNHTGGSGSNRIGLDLNFNGPLVGLAFNF